MENNAKKILDERLAKGEISIEEYEKLQKALNVGAKTVNSENTQTLSLEKRKELWKAYVGPKYEYYIPIFEKFYTKGGYFSFNIAGLLGAWWTAYRKMILLTFILMFFVIIDRIFAYFGDIGKILIIIFSIPQIILVLFFSNYLYYKQAQKHIALSLSEPNPKEYLQKVGGVSWKYVIGLFFIIVSISLIFVIIDIFIAQYLYRHYY